eukprot:TRINITY_DN652_c1_g1_i1.p1 TRINITY_DN652_c1_g1~~TRINITY_DN652_c1_g1_i1.p1  ORF type:complete len:344 (-),score=95.72 TRINITY_DN652_c1_g1_i1:127-1158(-)
MDVVNGITVILGVFSAVGSVFVIVCMLSSVRLRKTRRRKIMLFWAICNFMASVGWSFSSRTSKETGCKAQLFLVGFFTMAQFIWASCFAFVLFWTKILEKPLYHRFTLLCHALSWGYPLVFSYVLMATGSFSEISSSHCFAPPQQPTSIAFNITTILVWFWVTFVLFYCSITLTRKKEGFSKEKRNYILSNLTYLFIFTICFTAGIAIGFSSMVLSSRPPDWALGIRDIFSSIFPFLFSFLFSCVAERDKVIALCCGPEKEVDKEADETEQQNLILDVDITPIPNSDRILEINPIDIVLSKVEDPKDPIFAKSLESVDEEVDTDSDEEILHQQSRSPRSPRSP